MSNSNGNACQMMSLGKSTIISDRRRLSKILTFNLNVFRWNCHISILHMIILKVFPQAFVFSFFLLVDNVFILKARSDKFHRNCELSFNQRIAIFQIPVAHTQQNRPLLMKKVKKVLTTPRAYKPDLGEAGNFPHILLNWIQTNSLFTCKSNQFCQPSSVLPRKVENVSKSERIFWLKSDIV